MGLVETILNPSQTAQQPTSVTYAGKTLPQDAIAPTSPAADNSNNPSLVIIGGQAGTQPINLSLAVISAASVVSGAITGVGGLAQGQGVILPADVTWSFDQEKVIPQSNILAGRPFTELIRYKALEIDFSFTLMSVDSNGRNLFPQDGLVTLMKNIFRKDGVLALQNTTLNKAGVSQVIVKKISASLVRGQTFVPCRLSVIENIPGTTPLIIANSQS